MSKKANKKRADKQKLKRCAVLKIDLNGRFVFVDSNSEKLLGVAAENLYGCSIEKYLDNNSFRTILSIISNCKRYESFFEAVQFNFIASNQKSHLRQVVVSLNFIAGNRANYQFIILPTTESGERYTVVESDSDIQITEQLYDFVASLDNEIDWHELITILFENIEVSQIAIYEIMESKPILLASQGDPLYIEKGYDLALLDDKQLKAVLNQDIFISLGRGKYDGLVDACYPLSSGGKLWGLLRLISEAEIDPGNNRNRELALFIGNSLRSFCSEQNTQMITRQSG